MKSDIRARAIPRRTIVTQTVPFAAGIVLVWLMVRRTEGIEFATLLTEVTDLAAWQWVLALAFTALSYVAVGRYDRALHLWTGTSIAPQAAEASGRAAIAISQMTGMGVVIGTLLRWYLLPDLTLARAAALTAAVGASFLAGLAVLAAGLGLLTGLLGGAAALAAWAILGTVAAGLLGILALPNRGLARRLPALPRVGTVLGLVAADVVAAGAVFAVLLGSPDPQVLAAGVISIGAGLIAATPAGVGGFEAGLATLLPGHDVGQLMAAAVAFHLVYFALPALCAVAVILLRPSVFRRPDGGRAPRVENGNAATALTAAAAADCAEAGLVAQPGARALLSPEGRFLACLRDGRSTTLALESPRDAAPFEEIAELARRSGRTTLAYKIAPRDAQRARARGWAVRRVGREAWLRPADFATEGPAHRQLRRKLRHADKAGVTVETLTGPLPWPELQAIDAAWQAMHGAARGASMGRLDRQATTRQKVILARHQGRPIAFVSLHATLHEHTLDLMRSTGDMPDGTMHALIVHAIAEAASAGVPRLSLAAVPEQALPPRLMRRFEAATGAAGLRQFKAAFAPRWTPVYAAAPSGAALTLGLADMAREICG